MCEVALIEIWDIKMKSIFLLFCVDTLKSKNKFIKQEHNLLKFEYLQK